MGKKSLPENRHMHTRTSIHAGVANCQLACADVARKCPDKYVSEWGYDFWGMCNCRNYNRKKWVRYSDIRKDCK